MAFGGITAGTAWIDVLPNMAKFAAAMGTGLAKQGKSIRNAGKSLTRHITLPVLAAGAASIKLAADFDRVFEQMVGLAGVTRREVGGLKDFVLDLAPVVGKAPEELAKALYFLRSSGLAGKAALDALVVSAKLSTAGLGETEIVADAVSSAINAYGAANITASQAGDILAATVREGKGEADAIAPVLGSLLPLAARLGVGFDQVGGAIASMTRIGESAPRAATALRGLFTSLLNVSPKVTEQLKKVGLSQQELVGDLANPNKGLPVVLTKLEKAFGGNIFAIRKAFPNIRGLSGLLALTGKNGKATQKVMDAVGKSVGSTDEAFAAVTEGEGFKFEELMATLRVAGIRLGNVLIPFVTKIAAKLTEWVEAFQKLDPRVQKAIGLFVAFAAVLGPVLVVVGSLLTAITAIAAFAALGVVASVILAIVAGVIILGVAFAVLYKKSEKFRAIIGFIREHLQLLLLPFGLVIVAVATLARFLISHFDTIKAAVKSVVDAVTGAFFTVKDTISNVVQTVVGAVTDAWNKVASVTTAVFGAIAGFFRKWWPLLFVVFMLPLAIIFAIVNRSWRRILAITRAVFGLIRSVVSAAWNAIVAVVSAVVGRIVGVVRARFNAAKAVVTSVMGAIQGVVSRIWNAVANALGGPLGRMVTTVTNKFNQVKNWLMGFVGTVYGIALDIGSAIVDGIIGGLGGLLDAAKEAITGALDGALDAAKGFLGIGSPSKLFQDEVGKPIAQGIIVGASEVDYSAELGSAIAGAAQTRSTGALGRAVAARREMALRITNWRDGTGYFEEIADDVVEGHAGHGRQVGRMRRG